MTRPIKIVFTLTKFNVLKTQIYPRKNSCPRHGIIAIGFVFLVEQVFTADKKLDIFDQSA